MCKPGQKENARLAQVQVVNFKERSQGEKVLIEVHVIVEAISQRIIVIGRGGAALKALGTAARIDIEEFLGALLGATLGALCRASGGLHGNRVSYQPAPCYSRFICSPREPVRLSNSKNARLVGPDVLLCMCDSADGLSAPLL